jgi:hypothetical protein
LELPLKIFTIGQSEFAPADETPLQMAGKKEGRTLPNGAGGRKRFLGWFWGRYNLPLDLPLVRCSVGR